jgi:uncharacterized protein (DUF433 family)
MAIDEVQREYDLTREDIQAALAFAEPLQQPVAHSIKH